MKLIEVLDMEGIAHGMITIIGSGGKTSTLYRLAVELGDQGNNLLLTTTTAMKLPKNSQKMKVLIESDIEVLHDYLMKFKDARQIFAGKELIGDDKVKGYDPEDLVWLHQRLEGRQILVEGDGSKGKSLKIPASWEPQVPQSTMLTIVVIGWDIIGKSLEEKWIHRCHLLKDKNLLGDENITNRKVDEAMLLKLLESPLGLLKGIPPNSSVALLLNKVYTEDEKKLATKMASIVLSQIPRIGKVLLGEVQVKGQLTVGKE
ncbi:conserved hypothetical protein [Alkaliphilus metalliredigens QYMF]|uniref:Selenium-dependent hydroxylase accessory protein YqeC n=1 Tax=Alkaliphilus metalliredigens (strain QYMF) TaxID=293826 RepID=A6TWR9_ALKMQ|nr:selenium cofactor biosynthesis protein YqeC [Alkaliphilus metalliredigens]ABR50637.1 conserved hypothetical protein [Alkaliphilus metalliredigens QYMF]